MEFFCQTLFYCMLVFNFKLDGNVALIFVSIYSFDKKRLWINIISIYISCCQEEEEDGDDVGS